MINIGIIGVGGLVGKAILQSIELLGLLSPEYEYYLIGTKPSQTTIGNKVYKIDVFDYNFLSQLNYIILAVDNAVSKSIVDYCRLNDLNITIIDNSSQFRMDVSVPLIIPEINSHELELDKFKNHKTKLISNPNCVSTIVCMGLNPLLNLGRIKSLVISTYQAASGAGYKGLDELELQTTQYVNKEPITKDFWNIQYIGNVFSHNSKMDLETGYNEEELKLINETRKILGPKFSIYCQSINPTCIRVPTTRSHCASVNMVFDKQLDKEVIVNELNKSNGIVIMDGIEAYDIPNPVFTSGKPDVYIGRIRPDINDKSVWNFWISGDQLLKGAGYNSVQILKYLLEVNKNT